MQIAKYEWNNCDNSKFEKRTLLKPIQLIHLDLKIRVNFINYNSLGQLKLKFLRYLIERPIV